MKNVKSCVAIVVLLAGSMTAMVSETAFAQSRDEPHTPPWHVMQSGPMLGTMGGDCPTMGAIMYGEDVSSYSEGRIAFLKTELTIKDSQKVLWDSYAETLRGNFQSLHEMQQTMKAGASKTTPVDRLDAHLKAVQGRVKALEAVKVPLAALYEALTADQRKKADRLLTQMGCMM